MHLVGLAEMVVGEGPMERSESEKAEGVIWSLVVLAES